MDKEKKKKILNYALLGSVSLSVGLACGFGIGSCSSAYVAQANIEHIAITHKVPNRRASPETIALTFKNESLEDISFWVGVHNNHLLNDYEYTFTVPSGGTYLLTHTSLVDNGAVDFTWSIECDNVERDVVMTSIQQEGYVLFQKGSETVWSSLDENGFALEQTYYIYNAEYYAGDTINLNPFNLLGVGLDYQSTTAYDRYKGGFDYVGLAPANPNPCAFENDDLVYKSGDVELSGISIGDAISYSTSTSLFNLYNMRRYALYGKVGGDTSGLRAYICQNIKASSYSLQSFGYGFDSHISSADADSYPSLTYYYWASCYNPQIEILSHWRYLDTMADTSSALVASLGLMTVTSNPYIKVETDVVPEFTPTASSGYGSNWFTMVINLLKQAFNGWFNVMGLQVLPGVTLGMLVLAPIFAMLIVVIFKAVKQ